MKPHATHHDGDQFHSVRIALRTFCRSALVLFIALWGVCSAGAAEQIAPDLASAMLRAKTAEDHQQLDKADEIYREILQKFPESAIAYQQLCELAQRRALSKDSETYQNARSVLKGRFAELESKRFIALTYADGSWTRSQLELLERTHHQFQRFSTRLSLQPLPLKNKLVCIIFADREAYQKFAREQDGLESPWVSGHYSPRHDWIVFYDVRNSTAAESNQETLNDLRDRVVQLNRQAEHAAAAHQDGQANLLRQNAAQAQAYINEQETRLQSQITRECVATCVHETTHQLLFHTGVQTPHVRYPLWICEGLATCFETESPLEAFGPDCEYEPRRLRFEQLLNEGQLFELEDLIAIDRATALNQQQIDVLYNQSYALVAWLNRYRKDEFSRYLSLMRSHRPGELDEAEQKRVFADAFGDAKTLERAWLRAERNKKAQ